MIIRSERSSDIEAITEVTVEAFRDCPYGDHTEHFIIAALRDADALTISLVAEIDGTVVGHIAFSPVTIAGRDCDWYGLGPLSVMPEYQRQGIGSALVNEGLHLLEEAGGKGCVLVGDPGYYTRFGFRSRPELTLQDVPPENLLARVLAGKMPGGAVQFHDGFGAGGSA